jgi:hypothetical protein
MSSTKLIKRELLPSYFEAFTKRFLIDGAPEQVDVEVLEDNLGDQHEVTGARLLGISYDRERDALEVAVEPASGVVGDHRVYEPQEVWVVEEPDGFVSALEVVRPDGAREVLSVRRVGLTRQE